LCILYREINAISRIQQYIKMKLRGTQYQEIEIMLTSAKARSTVWDAAEFSVWLSASAASFANCPSCVNNNHNYERQCIKPIHNRSMKKYLPRSFEMAHALVVQCPTVSFHHTRRQPHCHRQSPIAGLCRPRCRPAYDVRDPQPPIIQ
jgi:hypothetical protein